MNIDADDATKVAGGFLSLLAGLFGLSKWLDKRFAAKADKEDTDKHYKAILDLYSKNDERRDQIEKLTETMNRGFLETQKLILEGRKK